MEQNNCNKCIHFYITYKRNFPYGCKAFGMISKNYPYSEIKRVSGTNCALFSNKEKNVKNIIKGRIAWHNNLMQCKRA